MNSFTFHIPTEIVFGKDSESLTASLVRKYGGSRVHVFFEGAVLMSTAAAAWSAAGF